jgi:hypothetical protein
MALTFDSKEEAIEYIKQKGEEGYQTKIKNVNNKYVVSVEGELKDFKITDRLGKGIDPKIKDNVIKLNDNGYETSASCEGHQDHAFPSPYIWIDKGISYKQLVKKAEDFNKVNNLKTPLKVYIEKVDENSNIIILPPDINDKITRTHERVSDIDGIPTKEYTVKARKIMNDFVEYLTENK